MIKKSHGYDIHEIKILEPFYIRHLTVIITIFFFCILFFFGNNGRIVRENIIANVWIKDITKNSEPFSDDNIPVEGEFLLNYITLKGKFVHYFDKNGYTISYIPLAPNEIASVNNIGYVTYNKFGVALTSYDKFATTLWKTNAGVYPECAPFAPVISIHSSENTSITLVDWNNNILSEEDVRFGEFVTDSAFAKETGDYIVGYINGYITMLYRTGKMAFNTASLTSEINVAKGVGISEKGSFSATVTGIRKEYLTLYNAHGKLLWYKNTGYDRRKNVNLGISEYAMSIALLTDSTIDIFALENGHLYDSIDLALYGMEYATSMKFDASEKYILMSVSLKNKSVVLLYNIKTRKVIWEREFDAIVYNLDISSLGEEYLIVTDKYAYSFKRMDI